MGTFPMKLVILILLNAISILIEKTVAHSVPSSSVVFNQMLNKCQILRYTKASHFEYVCCKLKFKHVHVHSHVHNRA